MQMQTGASTAQCRCLWATEPKVQFKHCSSSVRKTRPPASGRWPVFQPGCLINTNARGAWAGSGTRAGMWGAGDQAGAAGKREGAAPLGCSRSFPTLGMAAANGIAYFKLFWCLLKNLDTCKLKKRWVTFWYKHWPTAFQEWRCFLENKHLPKSVNWKKIS